MIDGMAVTDAHMHVPRLSTVTPAWIKWADDFGQDSPWRSVFGPDGDPVPARLDALLEAEGVDTALLFAEYSPRATGIQPVEDLLPLIAYNPGRFRLVANVNPAVHDSRPPKRPASSASVPSRSSCTRCTVLSAPTPRGCTRSMTYAPSAACR